MLCLKLKTYCLESDCLKNQYRSSFLEVLYIKLIIFTIFLKRGERLFVGIGFKFIKAFFLRLHYWKMTICKI